MNLLVFGPVTFSYTCAHSFRTNSCLFDINYSPFSTLHVIIRCFLPVNPLPSILSGQKTLFYIPFRMALNVM